MSKKKSNSNKIFNLLFSIPKRNNIVHDVTFVDFIVGFFLFYAPIYLLVYKQVGITKIIAIAIFIITATVFFILYLKKSQYFKESFIEARFTMGYLFLYFILYYVVALGLCMLLSIIGVIEYQI